MSEQSAAGGGPPLEPVYLNCDVNADLLEARVVITTSKMSSILEMLIAQSNRHETMILSLQGATQEATQVARKAAKELDDLKPDGDRQQELERRVESLQSQARMLKDDVDSRFERAQERAKLKNESVEKQMKEINDALARDLTYAKETATQAAQLGKATKERLDLLVIPDIGPLEQQVKTLIKRADDLRAELDVASDFVTLWHADAAQCKKLNAKRPSTESPMFNEVAKADYLDTLPVFQLQKQKLADVAKQCKLQIDGVNVALTGKLHEKVGHADIAEVANAVAEAKHELKKSVDYVDRRLHDQEILTRSIDSLESKCEFLRRTKADASLLELKGDADVLSSVNYRVTVMREDLNALVDKFISQEQQTRAYLGGTAGSRGGGAGVSALALSMSAGGGASASPPQTGASQQQQQQSAALTDGSVTLTRRSSFASGLGAGHGGEDCRRRFIDVDAALHALDAKKADRSDLIRLQEYVDHALESARHPTRKERKEASAAGSATGSGPTHGHIPHHQSHPVPASGHYQSHTSVQQFAHAPSIATAASSAAAAKRNSPLRDGTPQADPLTPHKPGTGAMTVARDGSRPTSGDASQHHVAGRYGHLGERIGSAGTPAQRWRSPTGHASSSIPDPADPSIESGPPPSVDGMRTGHHIVPGERAPRQRFGVGSVMVRDSSGCVAPVSVGAAHGFPYVGDKSLQSMALLPPPLDSALTAAAAPATLPPPATASAS